MSWAKLDDRFWSHPKVQQAWRTHPRAVGLHCMAITWCAQHETDGVVADGFLDMVLAGFPPKDRRGCIAALTSAGLWDEHDGGWLIHDYLEFNPSAKDVERTREWDRRRKDLFRDPELVEAIRDRDRDRCRYCGTLVNWKDRRGDNGGTYDHVTPRGANSLANVVVACRGCNMRKGPRTPDEAGMPLLTPGLAPSQNGASSKAGPALHTRPDPSRPVPSTTDVEPRADVDQLCSLLAELMVANDPRAKVAPDGKRWRDAARLLLDQDGRGLDEAERVIRFSQADDFWRANVLSMPTLREKFPQLLLKMRQRPNGRAGLSASDQAAEWLRGVA